ncbi:MAG: TauD/TfdA family dioxygenase [Blastocatellia bacterium]
MHNDMVATRQTGAFDYPAKGSHEGRYYLSAREAGRLRRSLEPYTRAAFDEARFLESSELAQRACVLPAGLKQRLADFTCSQTGPGWFVIGNLPVDPIEGHSKPTSLTEFALLAISARLGVTCGYATQRGGAVIQNFWPRREHSALQLGTSDAELIWHTEDSFTEYNPDFLGLLCLRGDPDAYTRVSCIKPSELDDETLEALLQPWYVIQRDSSYGSAASKEGRTAPIISEVNGELYVRYEPIYISFLCEEARLAHARLTKYFESNCVGISLKPGELLLIDNRRAVHGRTAITPRYDETDRWVQRVAIWRKPLPKELLDPRRPQVILI